MIALRTSIRKAVDRFVGGSVAVLLYHRVADLALDPQSLSVRPSTFEAHVQMLSERFTVLSAAELRDRVARKRLPRRAVVITFDDGYEDNLLRAAQVLKSAGVPACVFVSSGYVSVQREFWWDAVERCVLLGAAPDGELIVRIGNRSLRFDVEVEPETGGWTVESPPQTQRQFAYVELCRFIRSLDPAVRDDVLMQLHEQTGTPRAPRPTHRPLSQEQVRRLAGSGTIEVGAHTVDHVCLSSLDPEAQRQQVRDDVCRLSELTETKVLTFSYPFGTPDDLDEMSVRAVREAGVMLAFTTTPRLVKPWSPRLALPRFVVRDWPPEELAARLERWFDGER